MMIFQDIDDVTEWLDPLDYVAFWEAVEPYYLTLQDREHCDGLIAGGDVEQGLILEGLKYMAQCELAKKFNLSHRVYHPVLASTH